MNNICIESKNEVMTRLSSISTALVDNDILQGLESSVHLSVIQTKSQHSEIKAHELETCWEMGVETAERTLNATTQLGIRMTIHHLHCRYRTKQLQYRYNQLNTKLYADVFFLSVPSLSSNTCREIFVNNLKFLHIVPMKSKSQAGNALTEFFEDKGSSYSNAHRWCKGIHTRMLAGNSISTQRYKAGIC